MKKQAMTDAYAEKIFFTIYWRDGKCETIDGRNVSDALNKAGYGNGAMGAMDFWAKGKDYNYEWDKLTRRWIWTNQ